MKNYRPIYRDIKDWAILDECIIHDFSANENPIQVVEVFIGNLYYEETDFHYHSQQKRTPITRWITRSQYEYLKKNEGIII